MKLRLHCTIIHCLYVCSFVTFQLQSTSPTGYKVEPHSGVIEAREQTNVVITLLAGMHTLFGSQGGALKTTQPMPSLPSISTGFNTKILTYERCNFRRMMSSTFAGGMNETCRMITGYLKPTHTNSLPVLAGIAPSDIRRASSKALSPSTRRRKLPAWSYGEKDSSPWTPVCTLKC